MNNIVNYVKVFVIEGSDTDLQGYAEVRLYGSIALTGLKILEDQDGNVKIHYPKNPKSKRGLYLSFITDPIVRKVVEDEIIKEYFEEKNS